MTVVALEDLQTRSLFVRDLAASGSVFLVEGADGFARVTSPRSGLDVELMWTSRNEAARWADALVIQPRVTELLVEPLLGRHLPRLADAGRVIGTNWSDGPSEPEIGAGELDAQIRRQLIARFIEMANKTRQVWLLKQGDEPVTLITRNPAGSEVLPLFADRAGAERAIEGAWSNAVAARVPMGDFLQKAIMWCVETRRRIAPAYMPGPGLVEVHAWEMKAMLLGHMPARRVA